MKTKITVTRAGGDEPSEPEVDWEAFARTDGSACVGSEGSLFERRGGGWWHFNLGREQWEASSANDRHIATWLRTRVWRPVHLDITWRPIK